jgi:hypothetical protein
MHLSFLSNHKERGTLSALIIDDCSPKRGGKKGNALKIQLHTQYHAGFSPEMNLRGQNVFKKKFLLSGNSPLMSFKHIRSH